MSTNYNYRSKELSKGDTGPIMSDPQNWSGLPEGEKIHFTPEPGLPYAATKNGDNMIVRGDGGQCLDNNHESEITHDPIAGETRKVRMRCP